MGSTDLLQEPATPLMLLSHCVLVCLFSGERFQCPLRSPRVVCDPEGLRTVAGTPSTGLNKQMDKRTPGLEQGPRKSGAAGTACDTPESHGLCPHAVSALHLCATLAGARAVTKKALSMGGVAAAHREIGRHPGMCLL